SGLCSPVVRAAQQLVRPIVQPSLRRLSSSVWWCPPLHDGAPHSAHDLDLLPHDHDHAPFQPRHFCRTVHAPHARILHLFPSNSVPTWPRTADGQDWRCFSDPCSSPLAHLPPSVGAGEFVPCRIQLIAETIPPQETLGGGDDNIDPVDPRESVTGSEEPGLPEAAVMRKDMAAVSNKDGLPTRKDDDEDATSEPTTKPCRLLTALVCEYLE
uniref:Uncharacterized protein n=1 Tax=Zea mays TaxID=4577 RepID=A0A804RC92_MAIZE